MLRKYRPAEVAGAPHHPFTLDMTAEADVTTIVKNLNIPDGFVNATAVNGETIDGNVQLNDGDKVSLFPPSAGGSERPFRIFLSGIMQAIREDDQIEDQHYRVQLRDAFEACMANVQITDPWAENPDSVNYGEEKARHTFLSLVRRASEVDLLVTYLPVASMGSAMEMWQAFENDVYVIAISPMKHHWAVRFASHEVFEDLESFLSLLENGRFHSEYVPKILAHARQS